jgi:tetratricopeptide (TPR) repeat protein
LLNELLLHVASPASHKKVFIANKYAQVQDHEFFTLSNFERKVFYLLLQLILPVSGKDLATQYPHQMSEERYKKEVEIIKNLERIYKINEKRLTAYVPMLDSEGHLNRLELFYYPPLTVKLEIGYFLSWMYRRVEEYDKAYSLIAECIDALSTQPGDPRLYHSRALCMISQAYALVREDTAGSKIRFRSAIKDLEQAKRLFENANSNRLMQQILVGIDNTICDACVELYLLEGEDGEELITRLARPLLDNFKSKLTEMEEQYEQYPSYNHTEADLEYCEALILYKQRKIADASRKIENAVKRLSVVDDSKLLQGNSYLSFSNKRINQLAIRIYKYKPGT